MVRVLYGFSVRDREEGGLEEGKEKRVASMIVRSGVRD